MTNPAETPESRHEIIIGRWKIAADIHGNATEVDYVNLVELLGQMERDLQGPKRGNQFKFGRAYNPSLRDATLLGDEYATLAMVQGNLVVADHDSRYGVFVSTPEDPQAHRLKRDKNMTGTLTVLRETEIYLPLQKDTVGKNIYLKLTCNQIKE